MILKMLERRRWNRWHRHEKVRCHGAGGAADAWTRDVGGGGAFLSMAEVDGFSVGDVVGVAFRGFGEGMSLLEAPEPGQGSLAVLADCGVPGLRCTTFLYGTVCRRDRGARPGIAVTWEKAVTTGSVQELTRFLRDVLGIDPIAIQAVTSSGRGGQRCVFRFGPDAARPWTPPPGEEAAGLPGPFAAAGGDADVPFCDVPSTRALPRPLELPTAIPAVMGAGGLGCPVMIRRLAPDEIHVETAFRPFDLAAPVSLRFELGLGGARLQLIGLFRVVRTGEPTDGRLRLSLDSWVGDRAATAVERYLRSRPDDRAYCAWRGTAAHRWETIPGMRSAGTGRPSSNPWPWSHP